MRNLKMTTAAILTAGILALITACNMNAESHEHTFKTEWSSDETNHWHAASCEHKDEVKDKAAHTWDDGVVTKAATKDSTGIKTFTCTVCNKTKTEEIAKLNSDSDNTGTGNTDKENTDKDKENEDKGTHKHTYATEWTADATSHWHAASCEHKDEVKDKAAHTWDDGAVTKAATKDSTGIKTFTCTVCNKTKIEEIAKLNSDSDNTGTGNTDKENTDKDKENEDKGTHKHTYAAEWTTDATSHWHAASCEHTTEVSDKAAHTFGEWKITTQPTEETEGKKERTCSACGYKATETIAKLGHTHTFATTWTTDATHHWHSATCGHTAEISDKAEHTFGEWIVKTPATCTTDGSKERLCTLCSYTETAVIEKTGHSFATIWTTDETSHWHAATCGHTTEVSDKAAHTFGDWTEKTPATCTTDGSKERLCTACSYTETAIIEKTGHSYATTWTTDETSHWHAATCEHTTEVSDKAAHTFGDWTVKTPATCGAEGVKERECSVCKYKETAAIEKLSHTFAADWSKDATHHWHKATCEHTAEVSDKAEHTFNGTVCTVCNCEKPVAPTITVTKGDNTYEDPQNN